jgi:hypothetical protein
LSKLTSGPSRPNTMPLAPPLRTFIARPSIRRLVVLGCNTTPLAPPLCTFIARPSIRRLVVLGCNTTPLAPPLCTFIARLSIRRLVVLGCNSSNTTPLAPPLCTFIALPSVVARSSTRLARRSNLYDALSTRHCTSLHTPPHPSTRRCTLFDASLNALRRVIARLHALRRQASTSEALPSARSSHALPYVVSRCLGMQHVAPRPFPLHIARSSTCRLVVLGCNTTRRRPSPLPSACSSHLFHASSLVVLGCNTMPLAPCPSPLHVHRMLFDASLHALPRVLHAPSISLTPFRRVIARPSTPLHTLEAFLHALRRQVSTSEDGVFLQLPPPPTLCSPGFWPPYRPQHVLYMSRLCSRPTLRNCLKHSST